ncbi:hypothetical protein BASA81_008394 [Batrachochytrium salamandrivorans]|nr:hypothetical protein BASA81_008394 [Batrachochytrium salamandrivorans]
MSPNSYASWRKRAREARKSRAGVSFSQLLFSYHPPSSSPSSSSNPAIREFSQTLNLEESQAKALYDEVALWTPQLLISPSLLLKEYYQDRFAGIELLVERIGVAGNVDLLVKLVEAVFDPQSQISSVTRAPIQPELRKQWSEYRAREELLLVQGLGGENLAKHAGRLFATFARVGNDKPLALIRAWYVCLLPLPPPAVARTEGNHLPNKYYQPFLPPAEEEDNSEEEWLMETLSCLRDVFASTKLGKLTSIARRVLREYMELLVCTQLDSVLYSQNFCELAALGFGKTEPFACDAFWAGQYPHLLAWYHKNPSLLELFVASAGFTKRQPRITAVTLTSRDLKHASAMELLNAQTVVVQAHARLLDSTPSRRPLEIEEQTMGRTVLRILLAASDGGPQQEHLREWELLVCESLDCLTTLCERNLHCRELVMQCTRRDHYQANYLLQVLLELGANGNLVTEFAIQLIKTVLERMEGGETNTAFLRDAAKFAIRLDALDLVPLLGKVNESYVFEQLAEMCLDHELNVAAQPLLHLLKNAPIPETSSQRFVLALFREVFDANVQCVLLAVLGWGKSVNPLLGVLGPDFLPQTAQNLVECMGDGEPSVFDLLLVLQRTEPELVRMFIHSQSTFMSVLLGVTLENENEAVLQPACELAYELLKKFSLEVDCEYFTNLLGIYRALEGAQHLRLKVQLVRLLAIGQSTGCQVVQMLADSFPTANGFGGEHDDEFFQAWSDLLQAMEQANTIDLIKVWETLCQLVVVTMGSNSLPALMAQVLDYVRGDSVNVQTLQDLATAVDVSGKEAIANVFILATNKVLLLHGNEEENVQRLRGLLMPTACRMLLQNQSKSLFIDCLGSKDATHPLLGECFLYLFQHCADEELVLQGLLCATSMHAELLLSLHIVPKLLCVNPDKHVAIKFALMCELLEQTITMRVGNRESAAHRFFETYSLMMLAQLSKFHSQGSVLTISALHLTRLVVRLVRLLGAYRFALDQHLQACFGLIADLALGDEVHVARGGAGMMEEFADHYKCEEQRKTKLTVASQLVLRSIPETKQEHEWTKQFIKARRSSSTGGMSSGGGSNSALDLSLTDASFPLSPFRRNSGGTGGNNLFSAFNEPTTDAPTTLVVAAAKEEEDSKHRVTPFHVKIEAHIETLLAELLLVFHPLLKQKMLLFGLEENEVVRPTVFTLLSLLRWLANSLYSPSKSRLAGLVSISLLLALERFPGTQLGGFVNRLAASDKEKPNPTMLAETVVEKHVVKLIVRITKRLPNGSTQDRMLLVQVTDKLLKLF